MMTRKIRISCDGTECGSKYPVVPAEIVGKGIEMVFIIGEAPYNDEVTEGRPFIGKAGKILRKYLAVDQYQYVLFNSIMCKPTDTPKSKPTDNLIKGCEPHRNEILDRMGKGEILICFGKYAQLAVFGEHKAFSDIPYFIKHPTKGFSVPVYCAPHPMAMVYNRDMEDKFKSVLKAAGVFKI
jgi:uracil-DNA glycosylase family 4